MNDNEKFVNFMNVNEDKINATLENIVKRGQFYRTIRAFMTVLQVIPPINFMMSQEDPVFSDVLSSKFTGTSILCYTTKTYHWNNIWPIPIGAPNSSRAFLQSIPFFNILLWYKIYAEQELNYKLTQRGLNITPEGKIDIRGLPNVTIYRSQRQSEVLNLDEQIAVCLYEISKNTLLWDSIVNGRITKICGLLDIALSIGLGTMMVSRGIDEDTITPALIMALLFTLISGIAIYNNRKFVWNTDEMVKRMGYASAMASAIEKSNKYRSGGSFALSGFNAPEQILNVVDLVIYQIEKILSYMKLNFTPYYRDRINNLNKKPSVDDIKYNISDDTIGLYYTFIDKFDSIFASIIEKSIKPTL